MLSKLDDYPIHQTPEPIAAPAQSDRNFYDRYWYNGYQDDGDFYVGIGLGYYPNLHIMDCGFTVSRGGEQHAFHGSRRAPADPTETQVGPFRIEIVKPMLVNRVILEPNETGIECDLTFTARSANVEEGRQTRRVEDRIMMDATRFAQFGRWEGRIRFGGQELRVDRARVLGTKDRSWGIRPVGDPDPGGAPPTKLPQFFFLWSPIHWKDKCTHFGTFEDETGTPWAQDGMIVPAYDDISKIPGITDPGLEKMARVEHQVEYVKGTRRAARATITLVSKQGERHEIQLEPINLCQMKGMGYQHPEWRHGAWKGELSVGGESWKHADTDPLSPENLHIQQVMRARMGNEEGIGVLEQIAIGPHATSGLKGLFDGAL